MLVTQEMYNAIMDYGIAHYTEGWDFVVECYDMKALQKHADTYGATDYDSLLSSLARSVGVLNEYQSDIRGA